VALNVPFRVVSGFLLTFVISFIGRKVGVGKKASLKTEEW
jgi:hypothetical protein